MKKRFVTLIVAITFIMLAVSAVKTFDLINRKLTQSAYSNLSSSVEQIETSISANWLQDAENLNEISSILSKTDNPDEILKNIERNDAVYRYLYIVQRPNEATASDGSSIQRNDSHEYFPVYSFDSIDRSEAFFGNMGEWTYLYRCPVIRNDETGGEIYAQYLFKKLDKVIPEKIYQGDGNCYILDVKTQTIVYQRDTSEFANSIGVKLDNFFDNNGIYEKGFGKTIKQAILNQSEEMFHTKSNGAKELVYIKPMSQGNYYLISMVEEKSLLQEAVTVRNTIIIEIVVIIIAIFLITFGVLLYYRKLNKVQAERDAEREKYNHELQAALLDAEKANRSKTSFLANMSHEIRTPMNAVLGMAEMALREDMSSEAREYIHQIKNSGKNLLVIINDILDFSKIESGKMDIVEVTYEPRSALNDLSNIVNTRIDGRDIEFTMDIDNRLPAKLYGDNVRIQQILINLLNNAVKFTKQGHISLTINVEFTGSNDPNGETVNINAAIADTGNGIKQEDMGKLFKSFQQVDSKRNRNIEGTGLGLAICSNLLRIMNGSISVESVYNEGSTFRFTLPQKVVARSEEITAADDTGCALLVNNPYVKAQLIKDLDRLNIRHSEISEDQITEIKSGTIIYESGDLSEKIADFLKNNEDIKGIEIAAFNSPEKAQLANIKIVRKPVYSFVLYEALGLAEEYVRRSDSESDELSFTAPEADILIVDDTPVNLTVAVGLLKPLRMRIDTASGAEETFDMVRKKKYDLIFMDHMMPKIDGVEATHIIRSEYPDYANTPIIALTANAVSDARSMFLREGMNDFVAKPIELKEITAKLYKWLPDEKIIVSDENTVSDAAEQEEINIEGLNTQNALKLLGTKDLFMSVLETYYKGMDKKAEVIRSHWEAKDYRAYTIEVHSLKSSSRQIGADELADLAASLEAAGNSGDIALIDEKTEQLLSDFLKYKDILAPYFQTDDAERLPCPPEKLNEFLDRISEALEAFDTLLIDEVVEEMSRYSYDNEDLFEKLKTAAESCDTELCTEIIQEWREKIPC